MKLWKHTRGLTYVVFIVTNFTNLIPLEDFSRVTDYRYYEVLARFPRHSEAMGKVDFVGR